MSKPFAKGNTVKFQLLHRSQQDSRYHDDDASKNVLVPIIDQKKKHGKKQRLVDAQELQDVAQLVGENEGKAANYGVTYDDTEYNYLQHLKPIGSGDGIFIAKKDAMADRKHKNLKLKALLDDSVLPAEEKKYDPQTQQDIPDEIKGFKPDLNPDLREVLVALEDENYLDEEQDVDDVDVFGELLGESTKKKELTLREYDEYYDEDEDFEGSGAGYVDDYKDADWDYDNFDDQDYDFDGIEAGDESKGSGFSWEKDFAKYKKTKGRHADEFDSDNEFDSDDDDDEEEEEGDAVGELPNIGAKGLKSANTKAAKKKAKRKKGATTYTSSYSMSSSALCRTEQMTIIDDKFDVLKEQYDNMGEDEEEEYQPFDLSNERDDLMDMVDDFLDNYQLEKRGRRIVKKNDEMERYREAAMAATKSNSRVKNRNLKKDSTLSEKLEKMTI